MHCRYTTDTNVCGKVTSWQMMFILGYPYFNTYISQCISFHINKWALKKEIISLTYIHLIIENINYWTFHALIISQFNLGSSYQPQWNPLSYIKFLLTAIKPSSILMVYIKSGMSFFVFLNTSRFKCIVQLNHYYYNSHFHRQE